MGRRQIEPHFLFNSLNGIAGLVRERRNSAAVEAIAGLSDLLRRVLEGADRQLVPLAEELSFLERYVELQLMRFGDRLKVIVGVPPEPVPGLILQPLVENAIQHGVTLSVHHNGPALPFGGVESGAGVGIANTRGRLTSLYGSGCLTGLNCDGDSHPHRKRRTAGAGHDCGAAAKRSRDFRCGRMRLRNRGD